MKNKSKILTFIVIIILVILILLFAFLKNKEHKKVNQTNNEENVEIDKNQIAYQENSTVEDLKESTGIIGNTDIYEIQTEYDGRKVLTVKANLKYKAAFAGMIKKTTPKFEELDRILEENLPKYSGIWVEENSRNKILKLFNDSKDTSSQYYIDEEGYLKIGERNSQTTSDKKIENAINSDKQYILDVSSVCYIVDEVTGEILDYNFENMDRYQTYEYFEDEDKSIIFINQNTNGQLTDAEILNSVVEIL